MGAALGFLFKVGLAVYVFVVVISFITGYRWKERKRELQKRGQKD